MCVGFFKMCKDYDLTLRIHFQIKKLHEFYEAKLIMLASLQNALPVSNCDVSEVCQRPDRDKLRVQQGNHNPAQGRPHLHPDREC